MGLEAIIGEIKKNTEKSIAGIRKEADGEIEKIHKETATQAEKVKSEILMSAKVEIAKEKEAALIRARVETKKGLLNQKQGFIEVAFEKAAEKLANLNSGDYQDIIERVLFKSLEDGDEEVFFSSQDKKRLDHGFFDEINKKLVAAGKKGEVKFSFSDERISGGFIVKKRRKEINSGFDVLLNSLRDNLELEVAKTLGLL